MVPVVSAKITASAICSRIDRASDEQSSAFKLLLLWDRGPRIELGDSHSPCCFHCPHEHWFTSLSHARSVIEAWAREYNEERPKRCSAGQRPPSIPCG